MHSNKTTSKKTMQRKKSNFFMKKRNKASSTSLVLFLKRYAILDYSNKEKFIRMREVVEKSFTNRWEIRQRFQAIYEKKISLLLGFRKKKMDFLLLKNLHSLFSSREKGIIESRDEGEKEIEKLEQECLDLKKKIEKDIREKMNIEIQKAKNKLMCDLIDLNEEIERKLDSENLESKRISIFLKKRKEAMST